MYPTLNLSHYSDEEIMDTIEQEQNVRVSFSDEQIEALDKYVEDIISKSKTFVDVTETDSDESPEEEEYEAIEEENKDKDPDCMKSNTNNLERMLSRRRRRIMSRTWCSSFS